MASSKVAGHGLRLEPDSTIDETGREDERKKGGESEKERSIFAVVVLFRCMFSRFFYMLSYLFSLTFPLAPDPVRHAFLSE